MNTPATPKTVKSIIDANKALIDATHKASQILDQPVPETDQTAAEAPQSVREQRKRAQDLKKKGYSITDISEIMRKSEGAIRNLLKPYVAKPHLTQKIEGLDEVKKQMDERAKSVSRSRSDHPAGRKYKRSGGK